MPRTSYPRRLPAAEAAEKYDARGPRSRPRWLQCLPGPRPRLRARDGSPGTGTDAFRPGPEGGRRTPRRSRPSRERSSSSWSGESWSPSREASTSATGTSPTSAMNASTSGAPVDVTRLQPPRLPCRPIRDLAGAAASTAGRPGGQEALVGQGPDMMKDRRGVEPEPPGDLPIGQRLVQAHPQDSQPEHAGQGSAFGVRRGAPGGTGCEPVLRRRCLGSVGGGLTRRVLGGRPRVGHTEKDRSRSAGRVISD